jgi:hypothetical protein
MSKNQPPASSNKPIETRLNEWINSQGYPLEMRVARRFQDAAFVAGVSEFFKDPETGEVREIDVMAVQSESLTDIDARVTFVVECKSSRDHPWVFFVSGPKAATHIHTHVVFTLASKLGRRLLNVVKRREGIEAKLPLFTMPIRPAYGATQAFTSGKDVVFEAAMSVLKAATARVTEVDQASDDWPAAEIIIPVIATDARLFEYYLDLEGKSVLTEISAALLVWRNPSLGRYISLVFVVREDTLGEFITAADATAKFIIQDSRPHLEEIGKQWHAAKEKGS